MKKKLNSEVIPRQTRGDISLEICAFGGPAMEKLKADDS
jgi:hypothetical protein